VTRIVLALGLIASLIACVECFGRSAEKPSPVSPTQPSSQRGVSLDERQALVALYESTDGNHWKYHDGWLGPRGTECNWYGITCDESFKDPAAVIGLRLDENNLVGSVPNEIGRLTGLRWLDVSDNHLNGPLPDTMSQLTKLEDLTMLGNRFSGRLPDALMQRWLSGSLWLVAETSLLTDLSEVDFETSPSSLLCGRRRIVLRADGSAVVYTERCRNATADDRRTSCEVKQGQVDWRDFAHLGLLLEKNGFYTLQTEYNRNITEGTFESTRVSRGGKVYEIVNYADGGPFQLWAVERAIEGVGLSTYWEKTKTEPECPRWGDANKTSLTQ
jgi:Leucine Rich Repeat (LRR) protein